MRWSDIAAVFGKDPFFKLNYGMLARLICNPDEYQEFCKKTEDVLIGLVPDEDPTVIKEIVQFCKARNHAYRLIHSGKTGNVEITLSPATCIALDLPQYQRTQSDAKGGVRQELSIDPLTEKFIAKKFAALYGEKTILATSQILEQFRGRSYLEATDPIQKAMTSFDQIGTANTKFDLTALPV